jgi:oligosaccharide repeat unit polymerase
VFDKMILLLFLTSSYGLYRIENGAFAPSIGINGYENGVLRVYMFFWALFFIIFWLAKKSKISLPIKPRQRNYNFNKYSMLYLIINFINLLILLIFFDAYHVWFGDIRKGEFRISLGFFGAAAYGISKFIAPAIGAFLSHLYIQLENKTNKNKFYLIINFILIFLIGMLWGSKSFGIFLLLPAFTVLYWKLPNLKFVSMFFVALVFIIIAAIVFDARDIFYIMHSNNGIYTFIDFVLLRLTVMQAEVPWQIWNLHLSHALNIDYLKTLEVFVGDKIFGIVTGLSKADTMQYISYHYGQILTYTVYPHVENIMAGHNVTGTFFSEAVIALGDVGLIVFPIFAGILVGIIYNSVVSAIKYHNSTAVAMLLTFYYSVVYSWMSSGGLISLIHISNLLNLIVVYCVLLFPRWRAGRQYPMN